MLPVHMCEVKIIKTILRAVGTQLLYFYASGPKYIIENPFPAQLEITIQDKRKG